MPPRIIVGGEGEDNHFQRTTQGEGGQGCFQRRWDGIEDLLDNGNLDNNNEWPLKAQPHWWRISTRELN
jgi:hypothetical protein